MIVSGQLKPCLFYMHIQINKTVVWKTKTCLKFLFFPFSSSLSPNAHHLQLFPFAEMSNILKAPKLVLPPRPYVNCDSREDLEFKEMATWPEAIAFSDCAKNICRQIPCPATDDGVIAVLVELHSYLSTLGGISTAPEVSRHLRVASAGLSHIFHTTRASFYKDDISQAAFKYVQMQDTASFNILFASKLPDSDTSCALPLLDQPTVPGADNQMASTLGTALAQLCIHGTKVLTRFASTAPFVSYPLTADMTKDRQQYAPLFETIPRLEEIYLTFFNNSKTTRESWARYINVQGRMAHPLRIEGQDTIFDPDQWLGSVLNAKDLLHIHTSCDHPLPDITTLNGCFKRHPGPQHSYYLHKDNVQALALLLGDIVYRASFHVSQLLPELAFGESFSIRPQDLHKPTLLLGLFFHAAINFQSFVTKKSYHSFEVADLNFSFTFPIDKAQDQPKLINFLLKNRYLDGISSQALPFLICSNSLRGYATYQARPDAWLATVSGPVATCLNDFTGWIDDAKRRTHSEQRTDSTNLPDDSGAVTPSSQIHENMTSADM